MSLSHTHRQLGRGQLLPRLALTSGGVKPLSTSSRLFARKDPGDPCSDGTALSQWRGANQAGIVHLLVVTWGVARCIPLAATCCSPWVWCPPGKPCDCSTQGMGDGGDNGNGSGGDDDSSNDDGDSGGGNDSGNNDSGSGSGGDSGNNDGGNSGDNDSGSENGDNDNNDAGPDGNSSSAPVTSPSSTTTATPTTSSSNIHVVSLTSTITTTPTSTPISGICPAGEKRCDNVCIPQDAVCCNDGHNGYCQAGNFCYSGGCCPEGRTCASGSGSNAGISLRLGSGEKLVLLTGLVSTVLAYVAGF
ncbi:uncharacterized protein CTHT_0041480 [Thermochaetoides thermophila DSM 1495]|uniref:Uncharacterized protein n=1 Tax=Chaetomium thermophilum (strain DSM 1495 / CBS 144.50 / IMI 039719) TaxID=759272 RepID=G0SA97_CHATD|nr:hypothetical protein CTHT_0041480 [Thermochaetoides thermophila DSM 1495]EGS19669.1 hypothetical protein CTHT_0041480 [Thermochaetoides thermophila DSM 1495]